MCEPAPHRSLSVNSVATCTCGSGRVDLCDQDTPTPFWWLVFYRLTQATKRPNVMPLCLWQCSRSRISISVRSSQTITSHSSSMASVTISVATVWRYCTIFAMLLLASLPEPKQGVVSGLRSLLLLLLLVHFTTPVLKFTSRHDTSDRPHHHSRTVR